ncbi:MAG: iron-containing alcohol dehydrogenase, partial [bacterium]|nr:iron-containing alcohol dehydrogenase [bacterium]
GQQVARGNASDCLAAYVESLVEICGLETELNRIGVEESALDQLAEDATQQWTGTFNPRSMNQRDFRELYLRTYQKLGAR